MTEPTPDEIDKMAEPIWVEFCAHPSGCDCQAWAREAAKRGLVAVLPMHDDRVLTELADDWQHNWQPQVVRNRPGMPTPHDWLRSKRSGGEQA